MLLLLIILLDSFQKKGFINVTYLPNTIELENYIFKERITITPKLLWVRAFADIYNPKMAIDVLKIVKEKYPDAELCMVGPNKDGSLEETKKYAEDLKLQVTFTGKLDKKEWIVLAKEYDVFINTTHFDNTPVSVIEAMALGLPIVSTNVGGITFLLENDKEAFLVNDNDSEAMAKKIDFLIQNPQVAHQLTENALKKAQTFDWQQVKQLWNTLLNY